MEQEHLKEEEKPEGSHILIAFVGNTQHQFEMANREEGVSKIRQAMSQGFMELENDAGSYLFVTCAPNSGAAFMVISKDEVKKQMMAAAVMQQRAQLAAAQQQRPGAGLVIPGR